MNQEMRFAVLARDNGCIATKVDPDAGPCHDAWGGEQTITFGQLEADYVRLGAKGKRHELAVDHVALCPGHHRGTGPGGGRIWATSHRRELRAYLEEKA